MSVIIPTLAEKARKESLCAAIECILGQRGIKVQPIVVINGHRFDAAWREELESRSDIETHYCSRASVGEAQLIGVQAVRTPFYAFLDDDDLYTEDALSHRCNILMSTKDAGFAITNFWFAQNGTRTLAHPEITRLALEPLHSIFEFPWLHSSNTLFRTAVVGPSYYAEKHCQVEWTTLAINLSLTGIRGVFSNYPTAVYFLESAGSASKQDAHIGAVVSLMDKLRNDPRFPAKTHRLINYKYSAGLHALSDRARINGRMGEAWGYHLRSLRAPGGLRYLSFTRRLFWLAAVSPITQNRSAH